MEFLLSIPLSTYFIILIVLGVLILFSSFQKSKKLDFADMLTKNGRSVSLTKVLQMVGGLCGTWVIIKLTLANTLSPEYLAIYLAYVASTEGYSKFIAAKYNYEEKSVRDAYQPTYQPEVEPYVPNGYNEQSAGQDIK